MKCRRRRPRVPIPVTNDGVIDPPQPQEPAEHPYQIQSRHFVFSSAASSSILQEMGEKRHVCPSRDHPGRGADPPRSSADRLGPRDVPGELPVHVAAVSGTLWHQVGLENVHLAAGVSGTDDVEAVASKTLRSNLKADAPDDVHPVASMHGSLPPSRPGTVIAALHARRPLLHRTPSCGRCELAAGGPSGGNLCLGKVNGSMRSVQSASDGVSGVYGGRRAASRRRYRWRKKKRRQHRLLLKLPGSPSSSKIVTVLE